MAQTTSGMSGAAGHLDFSTDGSAWTACNGHVMTVNVSGGELNTGAVHTSDGLTPILKGGKANPVVVTCNVVYTDTADEPVDMAQDAYEAGTAFYVRWSPAGGGSGDIGYTSGSGFVTGNPYPNFDVSPGDPLSVSVVVTVPSVTRSTIGTAGW